MTFTFYWERLEAHLGLVDPMRRTKPHQQWVGGGSGCCLCSLTMLGDVSSWGKFGTRPGIQKANTSHMCESVSTLHLIIASPPTTLPQLTHATIHRQHLPQAVVPARVLITSAAALAFASLGQEVLNPYAQFLFNLQFLTPFLD